MGLTPQKVAKRIVAALSNAAEVGQMTINVFSTERRAAGGLSLGGLSPASQYAPGQALLSSTVHTQILKLSLPSPTKVLESPPDDCNRAIGRLDDNRRGILSTAAKIP
jgi:hypothetical protein